jgi:hypothetical protein
MGAAKDEVLELQYKVGGRGRGALSRLGFDPV